MRDAGQRVEGETSIYDARTTPARLRRAVLLDGVVTVVVPSKLRSDGGPVRALRVAVGRGHIGMHRTLRSTHSLNTSTMDSGGEK